ncbi:MAG TPA: hypothetical protein VGO66_07705 [Solirubrobacterales bacterium]|jgi:hypothetical protein|nr:hypothetical protein [Solirubrobacterales bacterium]
MTNPTEVGQVLKSDGVSERDACRLSQVSYTDARNEQTRWQMLVFVMGCAFGLCLIAAIVLFAISGDARGGKVAALVGAVASGLAMAWIAKQRNDASKEKEKALGLVKKYCSDPTKTLSELDEGAKPADLVVPM